MTAIGIVLLAHGARDPRWAEPFIRLQRNVLERAGPQARVAVAYLDFLKPDLAGACGELVAAGCSALRIVPVFLGQGGHVRAQVPALIEALRERHPGVVFELRPAVGEDDVVLDAIARVASAGVAS